MCANRPAIARSYCDAVAISFCNFTSNHAEGAGGAAQFSATKRVLIDAVSGGRCWAAVAPCLSQQPHDTV